MDAEDLLFDLAWKEIEATYKYIETIDTKAQMMIIVISVVLPLLISNVQNIHPIIYLILIISFGLAFLAAIEYIDKLDDHLDEMIKFVDRGYSSQTKRELTIKIREISKNLRNIREKKLKLYAGSVTLFFGAFIFLFFEISHIFS